jgi:hypothetical protein
MLMAERDLLVEAVVREVLGPRNGAEEELVDDPLDEYLTGVLAPYRAASIEIDAGSDILGEDSTDADDDVDPGAVQPVWGLAGLPSPTTDPKARPASLGISFAVTGSIRPLIDVCCTWARYGVLAAGRWKRQPLGDHWVAADCSMQPHRIPPSDSGVTIRIRSRRDGPVSRVSIFFVNTTPVASDTVTTQEHVFQPQIRIRLQSGLHLVAVETARSSSQAEGQSLALLYRNRQTFARGHLCAAMWRSIDPERPQGDVPSSTTPYRWWDGEAQFASSVVTEFSPADVRSEYVPVTPVNAPDMDWDPKYPSPVLDPEGLCELWEPDAIRSALAPIGNAYESWIEELKESARELTGTDALSGTRHIEQATVCLERIRAGIDTLVEDPIARLAFAFSNRAMALQSGWTRGHAVPWRPFQLAYQLLNLPGLIDSHHPDRQVCDLLWFPTGGGKTEAYLGLAAFVMAHRRLRAAHTGRAGGAGVAVMSRYTLRLLTIQQFRRALALITACEFLRNSRSSSGRGWRPTDCDLALEQPWGEVRFSVGLWVGGNVTPNDMQDFQYRDRSNNLVTAHGALSMLEAARDSPGDPAQVIHCPACRTSLAIPEEGYQQGQSSTLHLVIGDWEPALPPTPEALSTQVFRVESLRTRRTEGSSYGTLSVDFVAEQDAPSTEIDKWVTSVIRTVGDRAYLVPARGSRPGYFIHEVEWGRRSLDKHVEFDVFCPNPSCPLNSGMEWSEGTPTGPWPVIEAFRTETGASSHCPIPAYPVDEQVYHRCPNMIVATVDKLARLAFEPRAASIFGNVDRFNEHLGYYRSGCPPNGPSGLPSRPAPEARFGRNVDVDRFENPELILQDELHLIEGPLGSMVGIYEVAVDQLSTLIHPDGRKQHPKYIASTATVRQAAEQVAAVFARELRIFPPQGLQVDDSFFARTPDRHPLDAEGAGRLYLGICAPGRGAQTPIIRVWSRLLQHVEDRRIAGTSQAELDPFWSLVGYFNAIRELSGAVALVRQDIVLRLGELASTPRPLDADDPMELSSRSDSMLLPSMLDQLQVAIGGDKSATNLVVATSMFGTGVDVERLGLMFVNGQPKTTSSYIQATGRVGRRSGGLVVTFHRASRTRDLNHYEFFSGYHRAIQRHVEPVTVYPFAPRARDRALGPVSVALLRQAESLSTNAAPTRVGASWRIQQRLAGGWHCTAHEMASSRRAVDVDAVPGIFEQRAQGQPQRRRPPVDDVRIEGGSELDRWQALAAQAGQGLLYYELTMVNPPSRPVVLGDLAHVLARLDVAYEEAPNSLRDVEATVTVKGWLG